VSAPVGATSAPGRDQANAAVDLYWLPLGAGGHFVRLNGRVFECVSARLQRRPSRASGRQSLGGSVPPLPLRDPLPTPVWGRDELGAGEM
jgi:hypothetical protein